MSIIKSCIIAFAMYSKIPMPHVEWEEKSMRYAMVFFPLVGAVIGGCMMAWWHVAAARNYNVLLTSVVLAVIPVIISGGIHMDGFLDTMDALGSYKPKEEKLRILKDPHAGAFAIISGVVYMALYVGGMAQLQTEKQVQLLSLVFVLSRTGSGLSLVTLPKAKKDGILYAFSSAAHVAVLRIAMACYLLATLAAMIWVMPFRGSVVCLSAMVCFLWYWRMAVKEFGGITGDLAGWFLTVSELVMLYVIIL